MVDGRPLRGPSTVCGPDPVVSTAPTVAAIDCGTNSARLLISSGGVDIVREMRVVRLGQGVDRTGRLAPEAIERTRVVLVDYARLIAAHDVAAVRMVATSASRDAANRDDFVRMVVGVLGVEPEVISGAEEAALSFAGAAAGLPGVPAPLLVADIGGGSTELVLGSPGGHLRSHSMDVGCVRMTERHLHDDPPTDAQIEATVTDLRAVIARASQDVPITRAATFVGVAGTVTTVAAIVLRLDRYRPEAIHGSSITALQVHDVTDRLLGLTRAERLALPVMHPGRADVIAGGALVLRTLMQACGAAAVVASEHDILDGIAAGIG
jgi:exopolyphosphatase / guanosine-5'-triphosphate,3'-diphosphate pyrophosphatase